MSTSEAFPTLAVSMHPGTIADTTPGIVTTEWYAPSAVSHPFVASHRCSAKPNLDTARRSTLLT